MEVKKIKVIKEVEEEMFCFTRDEAALISDTLGNFPGGTLSDLNFTPNAVALRTKILLDLRAYIPWDVKRSFKL